MTHASILPSVADLIEVIRKKDAELDRHREHDLGYAIVRWAEREAVRKKSSPWAVVAEFLGCGSTVAGRFCLEHMPKNGWAPIATVPENVIVLAVEDLGDAGRRMKRSAGKWYAMEGKKAVECHESLQPTWWKAVS